MTLTETRPPETSDEPVAPPVERGLFAVVASGDHKRLGRLFAVGGLGALLAAAIAGFFYQLPAFADAPDVFVRAESRLATAATVAAFVVGIPALWIGLATYVVPLQIGGYRLALPRLHSLALWLFAGGSGLAAVAVVFSDVRLASLASSVPATAAPNQPADDAVLLFIASLIVIATGTLLAAASLVVTVLNRRAEGFRLIHVPAFTWSVLSTGVVLVLSTPVFVAGLVLLFLDQRYGGVLFADRGGLRVWTHELWILGRPEALVFFAAGIGIYTDIVTTVLRRPLAMFSLAKVGAAAAPLFALLAWAGGPSILRSPFAPFGNVVAVLVFVPPLLCIGSWLLSIRGGARPQVLAGALPLLAHFVVDALLVGLAVAAIIAGVEGAEADAFRNGQLTLFVLGMSVLALAAGFLHWMPKLRGRVPTLAQGATTALALLVGLVLFAAPSYLVGLGVDESMSVIGAVGAAIFALGLLMLLATVAGPAGSSPSDPYEGLTLEWAAPSPPMRHNFDEVPEIRSPYPLYDARVAAGATPAIEEEA